MGRPRKEWPQREIGILVRMRRAGHTWKQIGDRLGKQRNTCRRFWIEVLGGTTGRMMRGGQGQ
ncbi:hypothetical protein AA13595_0061 [Gluconacetobacter johannae DSM 13595]|uniref:Myb-like domain-containing protein n=1 Tax=Gluconacetobacter johannae TaxID=112140 RepID=A0A7W4J8W0_9PROT|nr:hypothetical protein [Gluconacetobacter johannae]MBB2176736.1 hypothetical protein [Gluconacetobacter johannae]GBQ79562.1 hypothetical protein AA13595_0061 [Gluconacetobacter johannae DSM 13595]